MVNASSTFHPIELMHAYLDFDYRATILADFQMPQWWSERRNYLFAIVLDGKGPAPGSRRHCHCRGDGWTSLPTTSLRPPPCRYPESTDKHFLHILLFFKLLILIMSHLRADVFPGATVFIVLVYFRVIHRPKEKKWSKV